MLNIMFTQIDGNIINLSEIDGFDEYYLNPLNYIDAVIKCFHEGQYQFLNDKLPLNNILDLGANIGLFSLYLAPKANQIIAYEPCAEHYHLAEKVLCGIDNVTLINAAVSDHDGTQTFFISDWNTTANSLLGSVKESKEYGIINTEIVKTLKMSSILNDIYFDFVKMDIEGCEGIVFRDPSLNLNHIQLIEVSTHAIFGVDIDFIRQELEKHQFRILMEDRDNLILLAENNQCAS